MSKYNLLWDYIRKNGNQTLLLTFDQVNEIAGIPIDHSFLNYKKELIEFGYQVTKISMKDKTVFITKVD